jgi:DMSO/TMAO reductase YedYZ molybdopterin-dependent catalytic subunit
MSDPEEKAPGQEPEKPSQPEQVDAAPTETAKADTPAEAKSALEEPQKRPATPALTERDLSRMNRRELLKLTPLVLLGAFAIPKFQHKLLEKGVALSDWASGVYFSKSRLARTFKDSEVVPFEKFPYNGYDVLDPEVDLDSWTLTVEGLVKTPGEFELAKFQALPKVVQNTRHVCVEGWDAVGNFGGAHVSDFLQLIGADTSARYVEVECADDYYESLDMASMLQPQSLLCYEMYGKPLDRGHGAPLRLQMPTKLGYKQAKYLTTFRVTNVLKPDRHGYWEDQGYSWHGGL